MTKDNAKIIGEKILALADINVGGNNPWDIQVKDDSFYVKVLSGGSLGFGNSYVDGLWECEAIDELVDRLLRFDLKAKLKGTNSFEVLKTLLLTKIINRQSRSRAYIVGKKHYDLGNDLYEKMLGETMAYSCGYWNNATTLDEAQEAKLDLICRKLGLKPGMKVMEIGCGWGSFMKHAAKKYGVSIDGITISREQKKKIEQDLSDLPVNVKLEDYRNIQGEYDAIISMGMFEHVGPKNYQKYMEVVARCLKKDGLSLLHTIGGNNSVDRIDPWIDKYIFPNAVIPSATQITNASEGLLVLRDWHNFGHDYDRTLMEWNKRFTESWEELKSSGIYDERFKRMWNFYLLSCAGTFRAEKNHLWQIVMSKQGMKDNYQAIR
jgi:cyclopropane-fatty-acyl-phospholipid synthase